MRMPERWVLRAVIQHRVIQTLTVSYEPEQLFAKFWMTRPVKSAVSTEQTRIKFTGVSESPGAYTLTTYRCKEGLLVLTSVETTRAIITVKWDAKVFSLFINENDVTKMTSREVSETWNVRLLILTRQKHGSRSAL